VHGGTQPDTFMGALYQQRRHKQALFEGGHGTTPDLIYARGVPYTPDPGLITFDTTLGTFILQEIRFSRDLGCDKKQTETMEKYASPPPGRGPQALLGEGGFRRHPHRERGYIAYKYPRPHHRNLLHGSPTHGPSKRQEAHTADRHGLQR